ncbi:MAG: hypothetical protein ABFS56_22205 [Pseudomonadota bacterium]
MINPILITLAVEDVLSEFVLRKKTATIGPNSNGKLKEFVITDWQAKIAACCSPSLQRTVNAIATFEPTQK